MLVTAERELAAIRSLGSANLACTLDALARAFPSPAYLFDVDGRLRWMSDEGALRLSIESARVGASRIVRGNGMLEKLSRLATALARSATPPEERLLHAGGTQLPDLALAGGHRHRHPSSQAQPGPASP